MNTVLRSSFTVNLPILKRINLNRRLCGPGYLDAQSEACEFLAPLICRCFGVTYSTYLVVSLAILGMRLGLTRRAL